MRNAWTGDFGKSTTRKIPAMDLLVERFPNTLKLAMSSIVVSFLLGIPLGVTAALNRNSVWDGLVKVIALFGQAAPSFWLAILVIILFAAIPALVAYNKFISESDTLLSNFEGFMEEFSAVLHREIHSTK